MYLFIWTRWQHLQESEHNKWRRGYSFINPNRTIPSHSEAHSGYNAGPGYVLILPAVPGCGCDYRCLALDAKRSQVACICPKNWKLATDNKTCLCKFNKTCIICNFILFTNKNILFYQWCFSVGDFTSAPYLVCRFTHCDSHMPYCCFCSSLFCSL